MDRLAAARPILSKGPKWRRIREFLQTDLLSPQSAGRYVPGIIRAAEYATQGVPRIGSNESIKEWLSMASFDMFSMILLGDLPRIADPSTESKPDDVVVLYVDRIRIETKQSLESTYS